MNGTDIIGAVLIAMLGFIWWQIKRYSNRNQEGLKEQQNNLKNALYRKDGVTVYIPRAEFEKAQTSCQQGILEKFNLITEKIKSMDEKRDTARAADAKTLREIERSLGVIEGKIK